MRKDSNLLLAKNSNKMKTTIISLQTKHVGNDNNNQPQMMTSLEIAELTGKQHKDVLKAIRKMELSWLKVTGRNFALSEYKDPTGRLLPCYLLTKTECLYIATKFNDEARAKLVIRWEELEVAHRGQAPCNPLRYSQEGQTPCALPAPAVLAMADRIIGSALSELNADAQELKPYIDRLEAASGLIECPQAKRLSLDMKQENPRAAWHYVVDPFRRAAK